MTPAASPASRNMTATWLDRVREEQSREASTRPSSSHLSKLRAAVQSTVAATEMQKKAAHRLSSQQSRVQESYALFGLATAPEKIMVESGLRTSPVGRCMTFLQRFPQREAAQGIRSKKNWSHRERPPLGNVFKRGRNCPPGEASNLCRLFFSHATSGPRWASAPEGRI